MNITDDMLNLISQYGWEIKTVKDQPVGSSADIYAEINRDGFKYMMVVDDGNCYNESTSFVYHIYVNNIHGKFFEGRIETLDDFIVVMRVLGFTRSNTLHKRDDLKSGIYEFDVIIDQFESGEIELLELTNRLWNTAYSIGQNEKNTNESSSK